MFRRHVFVRGPLCIPFSIKIYDLGNVVLPLSCGARSARAACPALGVGGIKD